MLIQTLVTLFLLQGAALDEAKPLQGVRRVVFLGDSITYSGLYIGHVEATLRLHDPSLRSEFIDLGLPSETVSGLSEPGHAGGAFPRPDLHERLDRVLEQTKPDLIVICYGMNDGIYYPFSEERFTKFREGMRFFRDRAKAAGAIVLHVTPTVFDPVPIKSKTLPGGLAEYRLPFEGYDEVLTRYSAWLVSQKANGWDVVDIHTPMRRYLDHERALNPTFRLADDGVHLNPTGHWVIATEILRHWGLPDREIGEKALANQPHGSEILALVQEKSQLLRNAWLTSTKHKRPGMNAGLPLPEAQSKAAELNAKIVKLQTK